MWIPALTGVTGGNESCAICGVVVVAPSEEELSRMNVRAFSAILLEGNNIVPSDGLPYRSRHSFANCFISNLFTAEEGGRLGFSHES